MVWKQPLLCHICKRLELFNQFIFSEVALRKFFPNFTLFSFSSVVSDRFWIIRNLCSESLTYMYVNTYHCSIEHLPTIYIWFPELLVGAFCIVKIAESCSHFFEDHNESSPFPLFFPRHIILKHACTVYNKHGMYLQTPKGPFYNFSSLLWY